MKKMLVFIFILLISITGVCAAPAGWVPEDHGITPQMNKVKIQGGYDTVASFDVVAIPSQAEAYKIGMPFSIDDSSVMFKTGYKGRLIANWTVLTNFKFRLDVEAEVMHHYSESTSSSYANGLGYNLVFTYKMSYWQDGKMKEIESFFPVQVPKTSSKTVVVENIDLLKTNPSDKSSLVGSADGEMYFCFDENTTKLITTNSTEYAGYLNGNYLAKVTFKIKAVD